MSITTKFKKKKKKEKKKMIFEISLVGQILNTQHGPILTKLCEMETWGWFRVQTNYEPETCHRLGVTMGLGLIRSFFQHPKIIGAA